MNEDRESALLSVLDAPMSRLAEKGFERLRRRKLVPLATEGKACGR